MKERKDGSEEGRSKQRNINIFSPSWHFTLFTFVVLCIFIYIYKQKYTVYYKKSAYLKSLYLLSKLSFSMDSDSFPL